LTGADPGGIQGSVGGARLHRPILRRISVALVTNYLPPYRLPLYRLLNERFGVEIFCFGGAAHYVPGALRDLDRQIEEAPFPAHRLEAQHSAYPLAQTHEAVIASTAGRVALPAAYLGARRARRPFVLWASLWRHPRTAAHAGSYPLMRRMYRRANAIVTYGSHVSRYVANIRGDEHALFVAPQAVEPDLFGRAVSSEEVRAWRAQHALDDGPLALYAGRLEHDKGVDVLLEAWTRSARPHGAALCIAGEGPLRERLGERAPADVRFAGRLPRGRLPVAYAAADFLVVPSVATRRFLEPWGLVCNEAMHQGRPVIATSAVGAAAGGLVSDGETGLVVPERDAEALASAIDRLSGDAELRSRLGASARQAVRDYTYERAADAFGRALDGARTFR
jgi:glycosyltransferase involved in cell wall biosynthesis